MGFDLLGKKVNPCSGCGACAAICGCNAISMEPHANGFLYPHIDDDKCVECGLCLQVCDAETFQPTGRKPDCYAVRHRDMDEVLTSRSGGFFMALCRYVLEQDGVVFGCQNVQQKIIHKYELTYENCKLFKGSKYVQSDLLNTFVECMQFLRSGRMVLFSGTGCQIHGLLSFLKAKSVPQEKLITVDIVCHGVPSPGVWNTYRKVLEQKQNSPLLAVDFREKATHGWADHVEKYTFSDNTVQYTKNWTDVYYRHILFRDACYACPYTTTERISDFTIADYWGIDRNAPQFDDNKGCSLVLIHSEKGQKLFCMVSQYIDYAATMLETSLQPQLARPIWRGWDTDLFWKMYRRNPEKAVRLWFFPPAAIRFLGMCEKKAKRLLKRILGRK